MEDQFRMEEIIPSNDSLQEVLNAEEMSFLKGGDVPPVKPPPACTSGGGCSSGGGCNSGGDKNSPSIIDVW